MVGDVLEGIAVILGGILVGIGAILLVAFVFVFGTAVTAGLIALAWNVLGLYTLFGAAPLSFWHVVGIAILVNIARSIFSR